MPTCYERDKGELHKIFLLFFMCSASLANLLLSHAHAEMHVNHPNKNLVLVLTKQWQPWSICTPCEMMSLYSCEPTFSQWCYFWIPRSDQRPQQKKKRQQNKQKTPCQCCPEGLRCSCVVIQLRPFPRPALRSWRGHLTKYKNSCLGFNAPHLLRRVCVSAS